MNDIQADFKNYQKKSYWTCLALLAFIISNIVIALSLNSELLIRLWLGCLVGVTVATINLLALAYAFYMLVIKKRRRLVLLVPIGTFLLMCSLAYLVVTYWLPYVMGFALGLASPLVFGAAVIFLSSKPA